MDPQRQEILTDLILEWEDRLRKGEEVPAAELAREYPELVEELSRRIEAMKATAWLENPLSAGPVPIGNPPDEASARRTLATRYRLDELIALGGFAEVWRAYDTELQRSVAIKIPKAGQGESAENFMAEARRVARLRHSAIVPVHDVGREEDQCFIVSEFMDGGSLATRLARTPVTAAQAVEWISRIADALEYAHLNGVIHRDVKPANILINHHDEALLADFGIAHSANKSGTFNPSLGTLQYMSPEQLEGRPVTPVSDVFSLAVVLYEALTGEMPYSSLDPNVVRREITTGWKKSLPPTLPPKLVPVLTKAMNRNPQQRHNSAAHFATDLRRAWNNAKPRFRWFPWAVGALAVGAVAIVTATARSPRQSMAGAAPKTLGLTDVREDLQSITKSVDQLADAIVADHDREKATRKGLAIAKILEAKKLFDAGNYQVAIVPVREALALEPGTAQFHHYLAACYFNMKEYDTALHFFEQASRLEPGNSTHHLHRGYCLTHLGRDDEAAEEFRQAETLVGPAVADPRK
jgi:tetratricopeptide (TPR) repeat protein